jgi:hypothetical protein
MPNLAISAQGTLIARCPAASNPGVPGNFVTIAELRNIKPPSKKRKEIDTTSHNYDQESFRLGILRNSPMTFGLGFVPSLPTHDHQTGLIKAIDDKTLDVYRITYPDTTQWLFSGYCMELQPTAPVDDGLTADVTIRPTGSWAYVAGVAPTS